jgi:hypothetical protein
MKMKAVIIAFFLAGLATSFAIASPPAGKGNPHTQTTTGSTSGTTEAGTTTSQKPSKVWLCQPTGSLTHPYARILVARTSIQAHVRRGWAQLDPEGHCPSKPAGATTTVTVYVTTTVVTTTTVSG